MVVQKLKPIWRCEGCNYWLPRHPRAERNGPACPYCSGWQGGRNPHRVEMWAALRPTPPTPPG